MKVPIYMDLPREGEFCAGTSGLHNRIIMSICACVCVCVCVCVCDCVSISLSLSISFSLCLSLSLSLPLSSSPSFSHSIFPSLYHQTMGTPKAQRYTETGNNGNLKKYSSTMQMRKILRSSSAVMRAAGPSDQRLRCAWFCRT